MSTVVRAVRPGSTTADADEQNLLTRARIDLQRELSRLSAFAHDRLPGPTAVVVGVRVARRLHVGGHGSKVGRIIELGDEDPGERSDQQPDLFWSASPERLAHLGVTCVVALPLRPALGPVVGSVSLFAGSPAALPVPEDATFEEVLRVLGVATSSVRQSAVARLNTGVLRAGRGAVPGPQPGLRR